MASKDNLRQYFRLSSVMFAFAATINSRANVTSVPSRTRCVRVPMSRYRHHSLSTTASLVKNPFESIAGTILFK